MYKRQVNNSSVTVYLDCDPNEELNRSCVIPIKYDTLDDYACIPSDELTDIFRPKAVLNWRRSNWFKVL